MTNDTNDIDLLRKWRAGDRGAGDTLIRRHYRYALGRAKALLANNEDDAVEATQHAMTVLVQKEDALERIERIEELREDETERERSSRPPPFRAYLAKVVYYSALSQTKRRAKQNKHDPIEDNARPGTVPRGAATMLAHKEEEKLMIKAMRSLSIDDQLVFYYEFVSEKKRTEIAELIGVSSKGIYKRVNKAKERLRARLKTLRDSPVRQSTLGGLETWLESMHSRAPEAGKSDPRVPSNRSGRGVR